MDAVGAAQIDAPATVFGPYRVLQLLGRGRMGTVHKAFDVEHRRMVALKRLPDRDVDERFRARFRREARLPRPWCTRTRCRCTPSGRSTGSSTST